MKEKLIIFGALGLLVLLLVGLNAASYVQKEKIPDSEANPNRSTYNTGPTGTRAFHDLLAGTGHSVRRWEKPLSALNLEDTSEITTFVIIGKTRKELQNDEISQILEWVEYGGRLVIIDRNPPLSLIETTAPWKVRTSDANDSLSAAEMELLLPTVDPSNAAQMTDGAEAAKSLQPTAFTLGVNAIQPSKFASTILIEREKDPVGDRPRSTAPVIAAPESIAVKPASEEYDDGVGEGTPPSADSDVVGRPESIAVEPTATPVESGTGPGTGGGFGDSSGASPPPPAVSSDRPVIIGEIADEDDASDYSMTAPVAHFGNKSKSIVVDFPHGYGTITLISDPFIVSNSGVSLVDNAQMAINVVSSGGLIVFDEYHQGFGSNQNRLLTYFYGTPVVPVFLQLTLLVGLIMLSLSRRFARPLPLGEESRISKLEYVAAMAQLKRRTKAYDLAIENIYTDFRRRVSRLAGVDNHHTGNRVLAEAIALRTDYSAAEIVDVMSKSEDIMHGDSTNKKEVLALAVKIREIEAALGLRRGRTIFRR